MRPFLLSLLWLWARAAIAGPIDDLMAKCWENRGHPEMSKCVLERAHASRTALEKIEREMRGKLASTPRSSDYPPGYVIRLRKLLDRSDDAYRRYRSSACVLHFEFSAYGTGPDDAKLACESVLDDHRVGELREAGWWLWK